MQSSLAITALMMGLVGGPHCVAMCGAACAGIGRASAGPAGSGTGTAILTFQVGRIIGYSLLGALAAASMQGLGWLTVQSAALRPVWTMFHVAVILLGLVLAIKAEQPVWLEAAGRRIWSKARTFGASTGSAPLVMGVLWALLPCGLLYSALLVAALAGGPTEGALVMALFALGTAVTMSIGPWLWLKFAGRGPGASAGSWGVRLAGLALAASSGWALWMGLMHDTAPWCATPQ